jgi:transcriptional regulator with XRE-family HTH domain
LDTSTINIAERVKDARRDAKLTQTELGKRIGKSKQWVSELERGNIKLSFEMAVSISNACNKTTEFFAIKVHK